MTRLLWRLDVSPGRVLSAHRGFLLALALFIGSAAPAPAQLPAPDATSQFSEAVELYHQQLYRQAQQALEAFRRRHPNHPSAGQALYLEGKAALALDRRREAVRLFEALQARYPKHPRAAAARLSLAQYFLDAGDAAEGRRQLRRIVSNAPDTPQAARALYLLGTAEREQGRPQQALEYFRRVVDRYAASDVAPAASYAMGATQVQMERYEAAAASFERLGRRFPNSPYAQNVGTALGEVYYQLGRYQQAADELQGRLPSLSGEAQVRALFFLAESYHQLGRRQQAAGTYRQILDRHATSNFARPARYGLAWVRYRRGDLQGALQPFGRVRQGARDSLAMKATYMEGVVRSRLGQPDGALSAFRSVARTWPRGSVADEARYEIGMLLYGRGDHDASAAAFRELLRQHPTSPRTGSAYYWLGNAYLADGASDRALKAYRQAIRRNAAPDSLQQEVRFQQAWTEYENGRFDRAAQRFSALADQAPQTQRGADALFWAADSHYETGNLSSARRLLVRYLENHPQGRHRAAARYALGWTYFKQQRYEPAARAFRQFLRAYRGSGGNVPYEQDARLRLGDCLYALRQYDDAVDAYRQVSGSGADYALFQIGQALNFADRPDEAIDALERLADDYPNSRWREDALYRAGYIHFQQQRYAQARQTYRTVIDAYSDQPIAAEAQYGIGDAYYNAGSFDKAVDAYLTVLRDHPDSPTASEAASSLFFALNASDNAGRAEAVIDSIASENPNSALVEQLRFRRAEAAYQSGDVDRALQLFRSFTRRSTNEALLPQAYYYLGIIYADRETYDEAKTYLRQLVDQYASSDRRPQAALRLGDIHLEQQNYESALEAYRVAAESDRLNDELRAQARYGEGVSLLQLGRSDEAENLLQRILEANRGGPLLASARLGLARIAEQDGRTQRALKLYRAVVDQSDGATGAEALFRLGRLLAAEGRTSGAIRELDRMSALYAGYPEWVARALLEQARAHRQRGETGEAAQLYEQVLQEHAGTRFAETAQEEKQAL